MADFEDNNNIREAVKRLGNPYASLQLDNYDPVAINFIENRHPRTQLLLKLQDPYASLATDEELGLYKSGVARADADVASPKSDKNQIIKHSKLENRTISKSAFQVRCRAIFRGYIPNQEKGRLRPHHREFIARNESRSAVERFAILVELSKYDLSDMHGASTQFNRERDTLTERKLSAIEKIVDDSLNRK